MKVFHICAGLGLIAILNLSACQKEDLNPEPGDGRVKRIMLYSSPVSLEPIAVVQEFEYDDNGRISRTSSPMYQDGTIVGTIYYDLYYYNDADQLVRKENFNANSNSPTGFINLVNRLYTYSPSGKLIRETIEYPQAGPGESIVYEYKNGLLNRTEYYNNINKLEAYTISHYDNSGRLTKEVRYASDEKVISTTSHSYRGLLLVKSDVYNGETRMREIKRSYDSNNNLLILESKELVSYSSAMSYVLKYEYFD